MDSPTVLCINDRPQVLELHKATLESHDYCVKIASSGYAAMKTLEETSVAAVLLEYKAKAWMGKPLPTVSSNGFPTADHRPARNSGMRQAACYIQVIP
jgi:CheY-like chemotaxis protein